MRAEMREDLRDTSLNSFANQSLAFVFTVREVSDDEVRRLRLEEADINLGSECLRLFVKGAEKVAGALIPIHGEFPQGFTCVLKRGQRHHHIAGFVAAKVLSIAEAHRIEPVCIVFGIAADNQTVGLVAIGKPIQRVRHATSSERMR